jgi:DNA polymerase-3 subunit delta'
MKFGGFLGNEELKSRLSVSLAGGKLLHGYLLCGPEGSGKKTLAALLAAAMECTGAGEKPCGVCPACRKVFAGQHPDVITVDDKEHKNIPVERIRDTRADVFLRPNEGRRKIYIFPRAQDLGQASQNALLKVLEEPPDYAAFLLLTTNADALLPTIRSRLAELRLGPVGEKEGLAFLRAHSPETSDEALRAAYLRAGGFLGQALAHLDEGFLLPETAAFAESWAAHNPLGLLEVLIPLEKKKREQLSPILAQCKRLVTDALAARAGLPSPTPQCAALMKNRTGAELLAAANALQAALDDLDANIGVGAVVGWLTTQF